MYSISNEELSQKPRVFAGDKITCPTCGEKHVLVCALSKGQPDSSLMYYVCGNQSFLAAIDGKLVA